MPTNWERCIETILINADRIYDERVVDCEFLNTLVIEWKIEPRS